MIELVNFTKSYGKKNAVEDFSLKCEEGEITALLGANGAGKTTILKAICARHFATSGIVRILNFDASDDSENVRKNTGFVEENANLPNELLVREFLNFKAKIFGESEKSVEKVRSLCSLGEIWNEKIRVLSKGQKERVNFAQALVNNPKVLVLDEPASGLDPAQIVKMRSLVKSLKKNRTIILSTHLMQEVSALCDKVCIISRGKNRAFGTISEILKQTQSRTLEEAFFKFNS